MDRSPESHTGQNEPSEWGPPARGGAAVHKEREPKEDGRYIIFYHFEDEREEEQK